MKQLDHNRILSWRLQPRNVPIKRHLTKTFHERRMIARCESRFRATEWIDHRKSRQNEKQWLVSTWFGSSYQTKARAFGVAQDKIVVWN
jgi:hypothetical protein